jgi:transposase
VIGVDTPKGLHFALALAPSSALHGECSIRANGQGYGHLLAWSLEFGSSLVFAIKGTGSFGAGLCRELMTAGFPVVEINRLDRSTRRRLGKDDSIDAEAAARAFFAGTATITPKSLLKNPANSAKMRQLPKS